MLKRFRVLFIVRRKVLADQQPGVLYKGFSFRCDQTRSLLSIPFDTIEFR